MGVVIGMDEAGYGPNLGPLVIAATVWNVPDPVQSWDFWSQFQAVISQDSVPDGSRFHVGDSKQVYSPTRGIAALERSVMALLELGNCSAADYHTLVSQLSPTEESPSLDDPWLRESNPKLPCHPLPDNQTDLLAAWRDLCHSHDVQLERVAAAVIVPAQFNAQTRAAGSKGVALSRSTFALLRQVWDPDGAEPTWVIGDKHGGRNRYDELLSEVLDGQMIFRLQEARADSRYRIGSTELSFRIGAEAQFPVAWASMVAKYLREVFMDAFNGFWTSRIPGLRPTKGYPRDAQRFRADIASKQLELGISDEILWREK